MSAIDTRVFFMVVAKRLGAISELDNKNHPRVERVVVK